MCGRFSLHADWDELNAHFGIKEMAFGAPQVSMPPRYNIAPTQPIVMVANGLGGDHTQQGQNRQAHLLRWGLMPSWVKKPQKFTVLINARAETVLEKPSFKTAMRHRRTLVPASGFYEWRRFGKGQKSQPYWVRPKHKGLVAFGGLMETWADANGSEVDTGCIISTDTNESFAPIHHRLPLVIYHQDFEQWLDCKSQEPRDILHLMKPVDDDYFETIAVSDAVNKVANVGPEIQNEIEPEQIKQGKDKDNKEAVQLGLFN